MVDNVSCESQAPRIDCSALLILRILSWFGQAVLTPAGRAIVWFAIFSPGSRLGLAAFARFAGFVPGPAKTVKISVAPHYVATQATSTSICGTTAAYCAIKLTQAGLD